LSEEGDLVDLQKSHRRKIGIVRGDLGKRKRAMSGKRVRLPLKTHDGRERKESSSSVFGEKGGVGPERRKGRTFPPRRGEAKRIIESGGRLKRLPLVEGKKGIRAGEKKALVSCASKGGKNATAGGKEGRGAPYGRQKKEILSSQRGKSGRDLAWKKKNSPGGKGKGFSAEGGRLRLTSLKGRKELFISKETKEGGRVVEGEGKGRLKGGRRTLERGGVIFSQGVTLTKEERRRPSGSKSCPLSRKKERDFRERGQTQRPRKEKESIRGGERGAPKVGETWGKGGRERPISCEKGATKEKERIQARSILGDLYYERGKRRGDGAHPKQKK